MSCGRSAKPIPFMFGQIGRLQHHCIRRMVGPLGLSRGQQHIILAIAEREGAAQSELAAAIPIRPASMTCALQRLERAGFIERRNDPDDQRISRVYLSEAGRQFLFPLRQTVNALHERALQGFAPEEIRTLRGYLERICDNLSEERDHKE